MADSARLLFLVDFRSLILIAIEHKIGATWKNAIIAIQKTCVISPLKGL